jgi:hypothetical protein
MGNPDTDPAFIAALNMPLAVPHEKRNRTETP